jgi:hypothetical protein
MEAWVPCWVELNAGRRRPRYAYITFASAAGELKEGMEVLLYFKLRGIVGLAVGEVVEVSRGGAVKVRVPHFVGASAAEWSGLDIDKAGGRIAVQECRVQPAPPRAV